MNPKVRTHFWLSSVSYGLKKTDRHVKLLFWNFGNEIFAKILKLKDNEIMKLFFSTILV